MNLYRIKECVDEFEYKFKDTETEKIKKFKITEKASQAKRSEYGDSAKYVIFTTTDKKGNDTNGNIKVTMNEDLIKKYLELAEYPFATCH